MNAINPTRKCVEIIKGKYSPKLINNNTNTIEVAPFIGITIYEPNNEEKTTKKRKSELVLGLTDHKGKVYCSSAILFPLQISRFWRAMKILEILPRINNSTSHNAWAISGYRKKIHRNDLEKFNNLSRILGIEILKEDSKISFENEGRKFDTLTLEMGRKFLGKLRRQLLKEEIPKADIRKILIAMKRNGIKPDVKDLENIKRSRRLNKCSLDNISSTGIT